METAGDKGRTSLLIILAFALGLILAAAFTHIPGSAADWASWVQAVGSIGAILASVAVVQWQNHLSRAAELRAARERYKNVLRAAAVVGDELCQLLSIISTSLRETESAVGTFLTTNSMIADMTVAVQGLPLIDFDESTSDQIVTIRRVCREVSLLASSAKVLQGTPTEVKRVKDLIDVWQGYIAKARDDLIEYRTTH